MAAILQTSFLEAFFRMKIYVFWFKISLKFVPGGSIDNKLSLV